MHGSVPQCLPREFGMPRRSRSQAGFEYVPVLCTHRPSLLPIGHGAEPDTLVSFTGEVSRLEAVKVVTRLS